MIDTLTTTLTRELFEKNGKTPYPYQEEICEDVNFEENPKIVFAISPNGGKTEMVIVTIEKFLMERPGSRVLILTHNTIVLRNNFINRLEQNNLGFKYQEITPGVKIDTGVNVIVSLPATLNKRKDLPLFDLIIIDEAHEYYETTGGVPMIQRIIKKCKIKYQLLLTGTPSSFNDRKEFKIYYVSMEDVYHAGNCSDVVTELTTSNYFIDDSMYCGDEVKTEYKFENRPTEITLDDVCQKLYSRINSVVRNSEYYSFKLMITDWTLMKNNLGKTLIACKSIKQADSVAKYFRNKGIVVALSHSKDQSDVDEIVRFQEEKDCKILVVVRRGVLGFNMNEIENVVDMTMTRNINRMFQLFCRATRKYVVNGKTIKKLFIKVIPSNKQEHHRVYLAAMLCLMNMDWFTKFNGKNFMDLDIPTQHRTTTSGGGVGTGSVKSGDTKDVAPFLGIPVMEFFTDLYSKRDSVLNAVCFTKVSKVIGILNDKEGIQKPRGYWDKETCREAALRYNTRMEFKEGDLTAYLMCLRNGWMEEMCSHMERYHQRYKPYGYWNMEKCYEVALRCNTKKEFREANLAVYQICIRNGWLEEMCSHMEEQQKRTKDPKLRPFVEI